MKFYQGFFVKCLGLVLCGMMSSIINAKPISPVQVSIIPAQSHEAGKAVEFVVRVTVTLDAEKVQIAVSLPETLNVHDGELHWQGPLIKGQEKLLRFTASLPNAQANASEAPLIQVQAAILTSTPQGHVQTNGHSQLAASAFYRWPTAVAKAAATQVQPLNRRVVERNGLKIQEYELRP
ncbi:hypothetical protein [Kaarinaea lacus]